MTARERIQARAAAATAKLKSDMRAAQAACKHNHVGHWDGKGSYELMHPVRLCLDCGLTETGSWWSYSFPTLHADGRTTETWSRKAYDGDPVLSAKRGRTFAKIHSQDELYRLGINL